jgi:DNA polymerase
MKIDRGNLLLVRLVNHLDELLQAAGVERDQVFITKCGQMPPTQQRDPLPEELRACQRYLDEQIELLDPQVIVTLGRISMAKFVTDVASSAIMVAP